MKNRVDKKQESVEVSAISEDIDTVDPALLDSMNENLNFDNNLCEHYNNCTAPFCPLMQRGCSSSNLYDEQSLMQRKQHNGNNHATTPYNNHGGKQHHQQFHPIIPPYNYYGNYGLYHNEPYPYFIPFVPYIYQLDEYDGYDEY